MGRMTTRLEKLADRFEYKLKKIAKEVPNQEFLVYKKILELFPAAVTDTKVNKLRDVMEKYRNKNPQGKYPIRFVANGHTGTNFTTFGFRVEGGYEGMEEFNNEMTALIKPYEKDIAKLCLIKIQDPDFPLDPKKTKIVVGNCNVRVFVFTIQISGEGEDKIIKTTFNALTPPSPTVEVADIG